MDLVVNKVNAAIRSSHQVLKQYVDQLGLRFSSKLSLHKVNCISSQTVFMG